MEIQILAPRISDAIYHAQKRRPSLGRAGRLVPTGHRLVSWIAGHPLPWSTTVGHDHRQPAINKDTLIHSGQGPQ